MTAGPSELHHVAVPPWRNLRVLRVAAQVVTLLGVLLVGGWLGANLVENMRQSQLTFGFGFLDATAGFDIGETLIPYSATDTYLRAFVVGLLNTLAVSVIGIVLATVLGVITGVARLSRNWLVNRIAAAYVEVMRNTPLLVQLVLIYAIMIQLPSVANSIALPGAIFLNQRGVSMPRPVAEPGFGVWLVLVIVGVAVVVIAHVLAGRREEAGQPAIGWRRAGWATLGLLLVGGWFVTGAPLSFDMPQQQRFNFVGGLTIAPELTALLVGLVVYTAAFIGEVVRGGIQSVRRGQIEAARSIGLTDMQTLRLVVFPQALRVIVPPLTSQYLNLAKNSSLAIAVGFADLFSVGKTMANQTGNPVSVIVLVMGTYLTISLITKLVMNIYNRRVQVLER